MADLPASLGRAGGTSDACEAKKARLAKAEAQLHLALGVLGGRELGGSLALAAGQGVEAGTHGVFWIAKKVAPDRVISTVDTQARYGDKSRARTVDGYKAHLGLDPDDELITAVAVTPANTPTAMPSTSCSPSTPRAASTALTPTMTRTRTRMGMGSRLSRTRPTPTAPPWPG